jgi:hypothetical protein
MLTVAQPYFESDDFRGDVLLYAAFPHPLLKRLVRFECGPDSLMRTDEISVPLLLVTRRGSFTSQLQAWIRRLTGLALQREVNDVV